VAVVPGGRIQFETVIASTVLLPEDCYQIERATWNSIRLGALRSRDLEWDDQRYELNKGLVEAYLQDKDGLRRLRKWRVPAVPYQGYRYDTDSSPFGLLRRIDEVWPGPADGERGEYREVPGQEVSGGPWGIIRAIYKPENNVTIEYRQRGRKLVDADTLFDIPDHYVKYIRWFAISQAYGREGDGQDLELSAYFLQRYNAGVARMLARRRKSFSQKKIVMGSNALKPSPRAGRARLPWPYGKLVR